MFPARIARISSVNSSIESSAYKKTLLTVLVAGISLGLAGCNSSGSSSSVGGNSEGSQVVDGGNDDENNDGFEDGEDGMASQAGVYTFTLRGLDFNNFGEREFGFVDFTLGIDQTGLWNDQLVMQDDRSNAVDIEPSDMVPLYKVYLEEAPNVEQQFGFEGKTVLLGVRDPSDVSVNYSIGLRRNTQSADKTSPWHGNWRVVNEVTRSTCGDVGTGTSDPQNLTMRVVDGDVFTSTSEGPYLWRDEFVLQDDNTMSVDQRQLRWIDIGEDRMLDLVTTLSQQDHMTGTADGDAFEIEYQLERRRINEDEMDEFCTLDIVMGGERI